MKSFPKNNILKFLILLVIISCNQANSKSENENDINIAEEYIENFQPEKAIPYLKKIKPDDPHYDRAQNLLKTINDVYDFKEESENNSENLESIISIDDQKELTTFQNKWAKEQIVSYDGYLINYKIENLNTIFFTLSAEASKTGSIKGHEDIHVPILLSRYNEALKKKNFPNNPLTIHFERSTGISNPNLIISENGWLPAEYLWYNVILYYGEGPEKKYIGTVIDGKSLDGVKYVIIRTKSSSLEQKTFEHIKSSSYYIKADDPNIKTKVLKFK